MFVVRALARSGASNHGLKAPASRASHSDAGGELQTSTPSHSSWPQRGKEAEVAEISSVFSRTNSSPKKPGEAPSDSERPSDWVLRNLRAALNLREITPRSTIKPPWVPVLCALCSSAPLRQMLWKVQRGICKKRASSSRRPLLHGLFDGVVTHDRGFSHEPHEAQRARQHERRGQQRPEAWHERLGHSAIASSGHEGRR